MSVFNTLSAINVNGHVEKKNGLTYLSWAWSWQTVKTHFPEATYTIYENKDGWNYFTDGNTCWVKTGVTIEGLEHIEYLPVMDHKNKSIKFGDATSFDINKAIQRSLTKAVARHGLGLYIYAGEDLPYDPSADEMQPQDMSEWSTLRTSLQEVGCNFRDEKVNDWICQKANVKTQDLSKLTSEELKNLNATYRDMLARKKGEK